jgi:hypothetical protein
MRIKRINEMTGHEGWTQMSQNDWRYRLQGSREHSNWTKIEYSVKPGGDPESALPKNLFNVGVVQDSWMSPRVILKVINRFIASGIKLSNVSIFVKGRIVFKGIPVHNNPMDSTEVPTEVRGDLRFGTLIQAFADDNRCLGLEIETHARRYTFYLDNDDYYWSANQLLRTWGDPEEQHLYGIPEFYRADQEPGLLSLVDHIIRTGPDWVKVSALRLAPGDMVDTGKFGIAKVLSITDQRCRMWFVEPFRTMDGKMKQEVEFSTDLVRLRLAKNYKVIDR